MEANQYSKVLLVTKNIIKESNTRYAQGGIAAAMGEDDHLDLHVEDTLNAGAGLCDPAAVAAVMVEEESHVSKNSLSGGSNLIRTMSKAFTQEGAHQKRRVLHRDETGKETTDVLVDHKTSRRTNPSYRKLLCARLADKRRHLLWCPSYN